MFKALWPCTCAAGGDWQRHMRPRTRRSARSVLHMGHSGAHATCQSAERTRVWRLPQADAHPVGHRVVAWLCICRAESRALAHVYVLLAGPVCRCAGLFQTTTAAYVHQWCVNDVSMMYKGEGPKDAVGSYRVISLLPIAGKVYAAL
eukprot:366391-Chlamydomonas_euryale.AAC.26